ncbi:hypothetical protein MAR_022935, partial [Mya arenaria]
QLEGFVVRLSTSNITNNNGNILPLKTTPYPNDGIFDLSIQTPMDARFCRLTLPKEATVKPPTYPIVLCEVEIFQLFQGIDIIPSIPRGNISVDMGSPYKDGIYIHSAEMAINNLVATVTLVQDAVNFVETASNAITVNMARVVADIATASMTKIALGTQVNVLEANVLLVGRN